MPERPMLQRGPLFRLLVGLAFALHGTAEGAQSCGARACISVPAPQRPPLQRLGADAPAPLARGHEGDARREAVESGTPRHASLASALVDYTRSVYPPGAIARSPGAGRPRDRAAAAELATVAPVRVLFIGNSYTYYHNVPAMMSGLAAGGTPARAVEVTMEVEGGATLERHWMRGTALRRIEDGDWDFVVLQEQSMLGVTMVEGAPAINRPETFHRYARLFDRAIRRRGARTVLYSTWSRRNAPPSHQAALDDAYSSVGRELGALVAPVGAVWQQVRRARPALDLYDPDGSHPSPAGSYLAASVLWGVIGDVMPGGFPRQLRGRPVANLATGTALADSVTTLVTLPDSDATLVQARAADVLRQVRAAGGYLPTTPPPAEALSLPAGAPLSASSVLGRWTGTMRLYNAPVEVSLHLTNTGGQLQGEWSEVYGRDRGRLTLTVSQFRLDGALLHFTLVDPRSLTPAIRHRAVLRGDILEGVAEVDPAGQLPRLLGRWSLRRP